MWDPHISETIRARKLRFYTFLDNTPSTLFGMTIFSARGRVGGAVLPSVNLGPAHIPKTIRAVKLKFYTHFTTFKCTLRK